MILGYGTAPRGLRLQLCRPLSGAVSWTCGGGDCRCGGGFNCAAPFRERLVRRRRHLKVRAEQLQLCRPLSGAVSRQGIVVLVFVILGFNCAAPFRERLAGGAECTAVSAPASIVPPPFGSG